MTMMTPISRDDRTITCVEVDERLKAAAARLNDGTRFRLTFDPPRGAYITHWFRPDPHAFEDCRAVGSGTVANCLAALDRYVAERAPVPALAAE